MDWRQLARRFGVTLDRLEQPRPCAPRTLSRRSFRPGRRHGRGMRTRRADLSRHLRSAMGQLVFALCRTGGQHGTACRPRSPRASQCRGTARLHRTRRKAPPSLGIRRLGLRSGQRRNRNPGARARGFRGRHMGALAKTPWEDRYSLLHKTGRPSSGCHPPSRRTQSPGLPRRRARRTHRGDGPGCRCRNCAQTIAQFLPLQSRGQAPARSDQGLIRCGHSLFYELLRGLAAARRQGG